MTDRKVIIKGLKATGRDDGGRRQMGKVALAWTGGEGVM